MNKSKSTSVDKGKIGKTTIKKLSKKIETCPSFRSGHVPHEEDVLRYRELTAPHVESYNYFLQVGLDKGIRDIEPIEMSIIDPAINTINNENPIDFTNITTVQFWMENVKIAKPSNKLSISGKDSRLLPRECRERGLMYSGTITGTFCYNFVQRRNGAEIPGKPNKLVRTFGLMPIMLLSSSCHLADMNPKQLMSIREEVRFYILFSK